MENKIVVAVKAIVNYKDKYLIIKRSEDDEIDASIWEFAGGKIDFGENLDTALIREVKEETGLNVIVSKLLYATTFFTNPSRQVVILTYKCTTTDSRIKLSYEHSEYKWINKELLIENLAPQIGSDLEKYNVINML